MQDKDYRILDVQTRDPWRSSFGTDMFSYALQLEGVDGWVELSQLTTTPAPLADGTIYGHTEAITRGTQTYLKFKKSNPSYKPQPNLLTTPSDLVGTAKMLDYAVEMLEELTGRKPKWNKPPENRDTQVDDTEGEPFDLAEIPFD